MTKTGKTPSKKKNIKTEPPSVHDVVAATFDLIAEKGLAKLRLSSLARKFGLPLAEFKKHYPSIEKILNDFMDQVDADMLENVQPEQDGSKRDLYFDMLMSRFDTLQIHRDGMVRWLRELPKYPALWCQVLTRWEQSLALMLDLAGDSPLLPLKKIGLAGIYAVSLQEWMRDNSPDMDKTMVAVDRYLEKGGFVVSRFMTRKK